MASCSISVCVCSFCLVLLSFMGAAVSGQQIVSFGFQRFDKGSDFEPQLALFGDANVGGGGEFLQITRNWSSSAGRVVFKKPIKLGEENPRTKASFGTYFTFSLSPESGDGLAFFMAPNGFASNTANSFPVEFESKNGAFVVEFDTKMDAKDGDLNSNHVGIDLHSLASVKVANASRAKLVLNSGKKLQCWIDYEATSKRVEVRLSKSGQTRPISPLLSFPIDLSRYFKRKTVYFGLSSSNSNSSQICRVYSWSFKLRHVPIWMHSQPFDPESIREDSEAAEHVTMQKKGGCVFRVLTAVIVGSGCGALGALVVLVVWTVFSGKRQVMPAEFVDPKVEYGGEKVKVIVVDDKCSFQEGFRKQ